MVDLLGMFRRRSAKRGTVGFARSREDVPACGDTYATLVTSPVRVARLRPLDASRSGPDLPHAPPVAELPREYSRKYPDEPQGELPRELPPQQIPRARPKLAKPAQ